MNFFRGLNARRRFYAGRFVPTLASALTMFLGPQLQQSQAVTIVTVPVQNSGNAPDQDFGNGQFGAVAYDYRIGAFEVTNDQYVEFLNAKAAADPLGLFNDNMAFDFIGGIERSGENGGFTYAAKQNMANKPVNFVSWYDAVRFANWMHNGQGTGDTETGAYAILGGLPTPPNGPAIHRNLDARWFLPSENEWYKAAYYDPRSATAGGPPGDGHYWLYPTQSDVAPTIATATDIGDVANPGPNVANYDGGALWGGASFGNVTTVGGGGPLSASYYGTFDQGGNAWEWNDEPYPGGGPQRFARGGSGATPANFLSSAPRVFDLAEREGNDVGFRLAAVFQSADFNNSGQVDAADLSAWSGNFGLTGGAMHMQGDADGDQDVDGADFLVWQQQFDGETALRPVAHVIPEPAAGALGLLTLITLCFRWPRAISKLTSRTC